MAQRRSMVVQVAALFAAILGAAGLWVYVASQAQLTKTYPVPDLAIAIPTEAAAVARGAHLVQAVGACATCHDTDMGGKVYAEMGPVGVVAGRNLTRGRGGIGGTFTDADWVRAIRYACGATEPR